jgi:hypothetical protein
MNDRYIFRFGNRATDGDGSIRAELGGKGAGLAEMTLLNIPVPPGFTISTSACRYYLEHKSLPPGLDAKLAAAVAWLEGTVGRKLGDLANPLLTSATVATPELPLVHDQLNAKVATSPPLSPTPLADPGRIPRLLQSSLSWF